MRPCILSIVSVACSAAKCCPFVLTSFVRSFFCVKQKVDHRGILTPNLLIWSETPYPLDHAAMYPVNCICFVFSCQMLCHVLTSFVRSFICVKRKVDHTGIRTPNLLIRSQTPYHLGHAAMYPVNCICYLFSCQVLSLVLTSFVRTFFCAKQKVDHRGILIPNHLLRFQTRHPLGLRPCIE